MENNQTTPETQEASGKVTLITTDTDQLVSMIVEALSQESGLNSNVASNDPYIGVAEAAKYLDCQPRRIYDLRISDRVRFVEDGRRLLTRKSWIDDYLEGR